MRRKVISSPSLLSLVLGTMLSLSAIYSGTGIAKADSVIATVIMGQPSYGDIYDTSNGNIYVGTNTNMIKVIEGSSNKVVANVTEPNGSIPFNFQPFAFDSANGDIYVANEVANTVGVIDGSTNSLVTTVNIPCDGCRSAFPHGATYDSANGYIYVANSGGYYNGHDVVATISIIDSSTNTLIGSIHLPLKDAYSAVYDSANGDIYVGYAPGSVSVIDGSSNTVLTSITTPQAISLAYDPANGFVYAVGDNLVSVIDSRTNTLVGTISGLKHPSGVEYNPVNHHIYVTNQDSNYVSIINTLTNTIISNVTVGSGPVSPAFDSANTDMYVTNSASNSVSVIATQHSTTLTLNSITSVQSGTTVKVSGKLTDNDAFNTGIGGKTLTFTGTGAGNIASVTTNPNGTFTATGTAPTTVSTGWTVQAHFAADSLYGAADSIVQTYNTVRTTPIPPETTITSAVNGNGSTITNGSTTFSSSIRFTFTATTGTNPVAGFECRLDNSTFSSCSSPTTLSNLAAGKHTFQVRAVDTLGNRDPTPARFSWTIATVTPPTKTTITSAVDGNGATVQNGGTTTSSSIKIAFTATQGSNPIAGFQCSLDNSTFSSCSSPAAFNNLAAGPHKFTVVAVDNAGTKDPSPATFGWTVRTVTPTQSIQQLIQLKHSMHLDPLTDGMLDIRLNIALQFSQNNVKSGTCVQLNVFISQVQSAFRVGHVTSAQASQLIQGALNIQTALGCTGPSSGNGIAALSASTSPPSLNLTRNQQQPQTTASSPSLLQPQSQSPYPYSNQYRYPSQYPQSQLTQRQQLSPIANAGISQTTNENTKVTLDGRASYSPTGGFVVAYQWTQLATTGVPVILVGANTATPTLTTPVVPSDTVLAFSLRVLDNHGSISTNPSVVYFSVKHTSNNIGTIGGNTPRTTVIPPQQQQQPIVPHSPHSQLQSPMITIPSQQAVK